MSNIKFIEKFKKAKWIFKLPLMVGLIYLLLSLPFITGIMTPSVHENLYTILYILLTGTPAIILFGEVMDKITDYIFKYPSLYESNLIFFIICLLFWIAVSIIVGLLIDIIKAVRRKRGIG